MFHVKHRRLAEPAPPPSPEDFGRRWELTPATLERLEIHVRLVARWRRSARLMGGREIGRIWQRHVADSVQVRRLIPPGARTLVDLGSGAGFPGLVLAILGGIEVHLVESDGRKCTFLREAGRATGAHAILHDCRIEDLAGLRADVVTARALAPLPRLIELARPLLAPGGVCIFHKGVGLERELTEITKNGLQYITLVQYLNQKLRTLRSAIKDGGQV